MINYGNKCYPENKHAYITSRVILFNLSLIEIVNFKLVARKLKQNEIV